VKSSLRREPDVPGDLLHAIFGNNYAPVVGRARHAELLNRLHRPVERDPSHDFGMREVLSRPAHLPNSLVRLAPDGFEVIKESAPDRRRSRDRGQAVQTGLKYCVGDFTVEIELEFCWGRASARLQQLARSPTAHGVQRVHSGFRRWRSIVERAVRAHGVVVAPPGLDQHLGFGQAELRSSCAVCC
jgi:hypothetical protein